MRGEAPTTRLSAKKSLSVSEFGNIVMTKAFTRMNAIRFALACGLDASLTGRGAESLSPLWQIGRAQTVLFR